MIVRALMFGLKVTSVLTLAALVAGCGSDQIVTVKYPAIWAGIVAGGPTGEWLWGDCHEFAPPSRRAQLCELRRQATETAVEREARLAKTRIDPAVCVRSLADRTCHRDVVYVIPGRE